jgi:hypothetical protein
VKFADVLSGFHDSTSCGEAARSSWLAGAQSAELTTTYSQLKPFLLQYVQGFVGGCSEVMH